MQHYYFFVDKNYHIKLIKAKKKLSDLEINDIIKSNKFVSAFRMTRSFCARLIKNVSEQFELTNLSFDSESPEGPVANEICETIAKSDSKQLANMYQLLQNLEERPNLESFGFKVGHFNYTITHNELLFEDSSSNVSRKVESLFNKTWQDEGKQD